MLVEGDVTWTPSEDITTEFAGRYTAGGGVSVPMKGARCIAPRNRFTYRSRTAMNIGRNGGGC